MPQCISGYRKQKKADVEEDLKVFLHVGLLS
jgi:hypothetical protein